jgi:Flp pilus assembly protein protease CpaA
MIVENIIYIIVLIALLVGTYTDLKKREVADWLNFSLMFIGIGIRLISSILYHDWTYLLYGLFGLGAAFLLALLMFYTGQWGGGDSKMIMGIGALIGLQLTFDSFLVSFLINTLIFGALFGLCFSAYLAVRNRKRFAIEFAKLTAEKKKQKWIMLALAAALLIISIFLPSEYRITVILLAMLTLITHYAFVYLKAVEKASLFRMANPSELVEGDWVVEEIFDGKKRICGPKDLGLDEIQIAALMSLKKRGKINKVLIKDGFPFVPGFLLAFIATYLCGNVLFALLSRMMLVG